MANRARAPPKRRRCGADRNMFLAAAASGFGIGLSIEPRTGWLRLTRETGTVVAWHRADGDWVDLARGDGFTDDVIVGTKIWSIDSNRGLEAILTEMSIEAEIPEQQIPKLEPRPDPRRS